MDNIRVVDQQMDFRALATQMMEFGSTHAKEMKLDRYGGALLPEMEKVF